METGNQICTKGNIMHYYNPALSFVVEIKSTVIDTAHVENGSVSEIVSNTDQQ